MTRSEHTMPHDRRPFKIFHGLLPFLLLGCLVGSPEAGGQPPGFDPQEFFNSIMRRPAVEDAELERIEVPLREELQIGAQSSEAFLQDLRRQGVEIRRRGRDVEYLSELIRVLQPNMRNADRYDNIRVLVADSPRTDARCFPGGTIVVFAGLIEFAQSEAALVGVLGHELSHLDHGHQLRHWRLLRRAQDQLGTGGAADPERMLASMQQMAQGFMRPFRPEEESVADIDGATWALEAGYEPRELARLFQRLAERDRDRPAVVPDFLRTHPMPEERVLAVGELADRLEREHPDAPRVVGRQNLRRRIPHHRRALGE